MRLTNIISGTNRTRSTSPLLLLRDLLTGRNNMRGDVTPPPPPLPPLFLPPSLPPSPPPPPALSLPPPPAPSPPPPPPLYLPPPPVLSLPLPPVLSLPLPPSPPLMCLLPSLGLIWPFSSLGEGQDAYLFFT